MSAFNLCDAGHWYSKSKCAICEGYSVEELAKAILESDFKFVRNIDSDRVLLEDRLNRQHVVAKALIMNGVLNKEMPTPYFLVYTDAGELRVTKNPERRVKDLRGSIVWVKAFENETKANREKQKLTGIQDLKNYYGQYANH